MEDLTSILIYFPKQIDQNQSRTNIFTFRFLLFVWGVI